MDNPTSCKELSWNEDGGSFWDITGQQRWNWKDKICAAPNPGDSWCICMWATTNLIKEVRYLVDHSLSINQVCCSAVKIFEKATHVHSLENRFQEVPRAIPGRKILVVAAYLISTTYLRVFLSKIS